MSGSRRPARAPATRGGDDGPASTHHDAPPRLRFSERHDVPRMLMRAGAALAIVVGVVMIGHLSVVAFRDRDTKARQVERSVDEATGGTRAAGAAPRTDASAERR